MTSHSERRLLGSLLALAAMLVAMGTLSSCGLGAGRTTEEPTATAVRQPTVEDIEPVVVFVADSLVLDGGECTNLEWTTERVVKVYLDGKGVEVTGTLEVCPEGTTTYVLRAVSETGIELEREVQVEVRAPTPSVTPTAKPSATLAPAVPTATTTVTPTPAPAVEPMVRFYPKNDVYELPHDDLCTEVIWETTGVSNIELEREGQGRKGVGPSGSELICFEDDKAKVFLHYRYPDGRQETKEIELRRQDEDEGDEGGNGGDEGTGEG